MSQNEIVELLKTIQTLATQGLPYLPTLALTAILVRIYLKVRLYVDHIAAIEQSAEATRARQQKVIEVLIDLSPTDTRYLLDDNLKERKKK